VIVEVDRKYLEINSISQLNAKAQPSSDCKVLIVNPPDFQLNKFFYKQIGKKYRWVDRLHWEDKIWINYTNNPNLSTYVLKEKDEVVGYFEQIIDEQKKDCEIAYFGILENYFGKKYGGYLLTEAIRHCFNKKEVKRIWVHTCSLDHQNALNNYLSRGMKIFKSEKLKINIS